MYEVSQVFELIEVEEGHRSGYLCHSEEGGVHCHVAPEPRGTLAPAAGWADSSGYCVTSRVGIPPLCG